MKKGRSKFWIRWKGSLAVKSENFTRFSGSITQSQKQLRSRKNSLAISIQSGFPKQPNLEDEIHSKWGEVCDSLVFTPLLCLIFSWFEFEFGVFESFHLDLTTWVPLDFHPSASSPSLTITPSPVHLKKYYSFDPRAPF